MNILQRQNISHATVVINAPAVAPAAPKHATVPRVGTLPGLLTTKRGSSLPVAWAIAVEYLYFAFWYMENETVRTSVTLARGARAPNSTNQESAVLKTTQVPCLKAFAQLQPLKLRNRIMSTRPKLTPSILHPSTLEIFNSMLHVIASISMHLSPPLECVE